MLKHDKRSGMVKKFGEKIRFVCSMEKICIHQPIQWIKIASMDMCIPVFPVRYSRRALLYRFQYEHYTKFHNICNSFLLMRVPGMAAIYPLP